MRRAWRILFTTGLVVVLVPCVAVGWLEQRDWVTDGVYSAAIYAGVVLILSWALGELLFRFVPAAGPVIVAAAISLAAVPGFYINSATFLGRGAADFNTWHLLPLFAVMYQMAATVLVAIAVMLVLGVRMGYRALRKNAAA